MTGGFLTNGWCLQTMTYSSPSSLIKTFKINTIWEDGSSNMTTESRSIENNFFVFSFWHNFVYFLSAAFYKFFIIELVCTADTSCFYNTFGRCIASSYAQMTSGLLTVTCVRFSVVWIFV